MPAALGTVGGNATVGRAVVFETGGGGGEVGRAERAVGVASAGIPFWVGVETALGRLGSGARGGGAAYEGEGGGVEAWTRESATAPSGVSVAFPAFPSMACADVLVSRMSGVYQSTGYAATPESERVALGRTWWRWAGLPVVCSACYRRSGPWYARPFLVECPGSDAAESSDMVKSSKPSKLKATAPKKAPKGDLGEEPVRIAYVDDDLELTRMVSDALADEGWEILVANDGESGLELILSEQPDIILLDVMMPGLTGWEICKYIRSKPDWAGTPILMLTGIGERMNALTAPLYGADAHLDKPFDIDELVETVRQLVAQSLAAE